MEEEGREGEGAEGGEGEGSLVDDSSLVGLGSVTIEKMCRSERLVHQTHTTVQK